MQFELNREINKVKAVDELPPSLKISRYDAAHRGHFISTLAYLGMVRNRWVDFCYFLHLTPQRKLIVKTYHFTELFYMIE